MDESSFFIILIIKPETVKNTDEKIKKRAQKAFDQKDDLNGFLILWELEKKSFYKYISEKKKFKKRLFWDEFLIVNGHLHELEKVDLIDQLLYDYLVKAGVTSQPFVELMSAMYSSNFVKAIKRTGSFFNKDHMKVIGNLQLTKDFAIHKKVWDYLYQKDNRIWKDIQKKSIQLEYIDLEGVLAGLTYWLENERFKMGKEVDKYQLTEVYNFFVSFYFFHFENDIDSISYENLEKNFANLLGGRTRNRLDPILERIYEWIRFNSSIIDAYCYDDNFTPYEDHGRILFKYADPAQFEAWKAEGKRYEINERIYLGISRQQVQYMEEEGITEIPGNNEEHQDQNRYFFIRKWATINFLEDMGIRNFTIGGRRIQADQLLTLIQGFSQNLFMRYEYSLDKFKNVRKNFTLAYLDQFKENYDQDRIVEAYIFETVNEYNERNKNVIPELSRSEVEDLLQIFSEKPENFNDFDRFNLSYNVELKPYLNLGNYIFCPTFSMANNTWFYSFAQSMIFNNRHSDEQKEGTNRMEEHLADKLGGKGWESIWLGKNDSGKIPGDVDVLVMDEISMILIQVKRSYFRTNLKSAYNERCVSIEKAIGQLNKAVPYILEEFGKKRHFEKWVVTTSFENILLEQEGCLIVNYFDLIQSLMNKEVASLNDLINYIRNDQNFLLAVKEYEKWGVL